VKNTLQPTFLKIGPLKLVFFGGKGGVGKSTCATACALKLAMEYPHEQFLLISTDPAHSLKNILSDVALPKNLDVRELDAKQSLHDFKILHDAALKEIAERGTFLDKTDIQGLMDSALPGMDELAAYFDIAKWLQDDHYARILIDTAPTGHTLRLLNMSELIRRWLIALDTLLAKNRYIRAHFAKNKQLDHLDVFLLDMNDALNTVSTLLQDENRCHFVLVTLAQQGATLMGTELADLLVNEHDLMLHTLKAEKSAIKNSTNLNGQELLDIRDEYIAQRIDQTLLDNEMGILFLGFMHNIETKLPSDILLIQPLGKPTF
jgi:arsenite-transporting ATPase